MNIDQQNVIKLLGMESLPDDRKLSILTKITELVEKRLIARMLKELSEAKQSEFAKILEKNQPESTQNFISANFPDFQNWLVEEVNKIKQDLSQLGTID